MGIKPLRELDVLEELYSDENSSEINLKNLSQMLGIQQNRLGEALNIQSSVLSRNPYASENPILKQWLSIFNSIIKIISTTEASLTNEQVKVKMTRWLKLPRPEFDNKSALDFMLENKSRKVLGVLEQIYSVI